MKNKDLLCAGLTIAIGAVSLAGCATTAKLSAPPAAPPPTTTAAAPAPVTEPEQPILAGKVAETMNAGAYTYISLEKDGRKTWSAVPKAKVAVGDEVVLFPGIDMVNFSSSILNRTFANIHFSAGVKEVTAGSAAEPAAPTETQALPTNHPAMPKPEPDAAGSAHIKQQAQSLSGKIVETVSAGGYTYIYLENDGVKTWAAIPATKATVGDTISIRPGYTMPSFTSKSLNRTFENIIFSPGSAAN